MTTLSSRLGLTGSEQAVPFPHVPSLQSGLRTPENESITALREDVQARLVTSLGQRLYGGQIEPDELERHVFDAITAALAATDRPLSTVDRVHLAQDITDDILGHGPLEPLLRDRNVTEIMVAGPDKVWVEKEGILHRTDVKFTDEAHLRRTIERIVARIGRRIDEASPMVDARLPDGSRVNAVVPPISLDGPCLTIRKFSREPFTAPDLVAMGTLSPAALETLKACVGGKMNILISGGTGAGKTTTLNVLSSFIPESERVVTIEDAAELQLNQPHVIRLEARPANIEGQGVVTVRDLVRNSLRMRPDRIIVGEVRDATAVDMLQAMNTGHEGSLTTVHANSPFDALSRLEAMVLMADMGLPVPVIREYAGRALDVIVQQSRMRDGSRRITQISEVVGVEEDSVQLRDLFTFRYDEDPASPRIGSLQATGAVPGFLDRLAQHGVTLPAETFAVDAWGEQ